MTRFTVYLSWSSVASIASGGRGRLDLGTRSQGGDPEHRELLRRHGARPAKENESERDPNPGEDGDGEEGRLEAFGRRERVRADHPLQPLRRESEVFLDRRQRDGHDRRVEDDHEEGAAEQRQRPPTARVGLRWGWCGVPQLLSHLDLLSDSFLRRWSCPRDLRGERFGWRRIQRGPRSSSRWTPAMARAG